MRRDDVFEGVLQVGGVVLSVVFVVALLGLIVPLAREHCLVKGNGGVYSVHSGWRFNLADFIFNPAPDTNTCVRNTLDREALSTIGIWPLGSPEHQLAEHGIGR